MRPWRTLGHFQKVVFVQYFNYFFSCFCCFLYVCCLELTEQALVCFEYSKHPDIRTYDFGVQADLVVIYLVLSEKSA